MRSNMKTNKLFLLFSVFPLLLSGCQSEGGRVKTYSITWKNYDGTILENDYPVSEGTMPSYDGEKPYRDYDENYSYDFSGWTPEVVPVTKSETYTATYSQRETTCVITFDLSGGSSEAYNKLPRKDISVESISKESFFFDVVKEDYHFKGWTYNGVLVFDQDGNKLSDPAIERRMTFVAKFEAHKPVVTLINNSNGYATITGEGTYEPDSMVTLEIVSIYIGVSLTGWYENDKLLSTATTYTFNVGKKDRTIEARFNFTEYKITYDLAGGTNDSDNITTYTINTEFTFKEASKTGYTFRGWYKGSTQVTKIEKGSYGDLALKARYGINTYTITVTSEDTSKGTVSKEGSGEYMSVCILTATAKTGYVFEGWYLDGKKVSEETVYSFGVDARNYDFTAKFISKAEAYGTTPIVSADGKTIKCGLYPRSEVIETKAINELKTLPETADNLYTRDHKYYSKVNNKWYKCEPIEWIVIAHSEGNKQYQLISKELVDAKVFNSTAPSSYQESEIRSYLKTTFFNKAFKLNSSYVEDKTLPEGLLVDKVFLLSKSDYENEAYGLNTFDARKGITNDYVNAVADSTIKYIYTRTVSGNNVTAINSESGIIINLNASDNSVIKNPQGIRPSIVIKIS